MLSIHQTRKCHGSETTTVTATATTTTTATTSV